MQYRLIEYLLIVLLLPGALQAVAQPASNEVHLYNLGNIADLPVDSEELSALGNLMDHGPNNYCILFTGDITSLDLTDPVQRVSDSLRLAGIVERLSSNKLLQLIFIPGDRDWASSGKNGWENVLALEQLIENLPFEKIKWTPGHGCPGPIQIEVNEWLSLVILNTQFWNHPWDKPSPTDALCKISSKEEFMEELEDMIAESKNKNLVIAGHFPAISSGEYGGGMTLKKHIFPLTDFKPGLWIPLPIVGSFYPSYRKNIGTSMDLINSHYEEFNSNLKNIFHDHPGLIYLSGHEYLQQVIYSNNSYFISSGGLSQSRKAAATKEDLYTSKNRGLARIEYQENGGVNLRFFNMQDSSLSLESSISLFHSSCDSTKGLSPINESYSPCNQEYEEAKSMSLSYGQTTAVAGEEYSASKVKELFLGKHYRRTWTEPVTVNYLDLDTTFGGLTPIKRGGGRQTTSLKFKAGNGCEYVFRSVNKDPKKALPYELRETMVADLVKDQTSTQQPYGALATSILLDQLDILHPHPVLYVLPPDKKLGVFRHDYANLFGMLEESPKGPKESCRGFGDSDEVLRSYKLFRKLYQDHDNQIKADEFVKAKVFDIFVGDWGRHEDNWKWAGYKRDGIMIYRPVPRDRDHVFSVWDGVLPWLADRKWAKPSGDHFGYQVNDIRSLTWSARHLDRIVLAGVSKDVWLEKSAEVRTRLNDELIEKSIRNMPPEIYDISGLEIENKLIRRRENLDEYILDYYHLLAKYVDVLGSSKKEVFKLTRLPDGSVNVKVSNRKGNKQLFDRTFIRDETKEIRLYGLGNEDEFHLKGESEKSILVRVIGGDGPDKITDESHVNGPGKKTKIYERDSGSQVETGSEGKRINSWNDQLYHYDRHAFAYNTYLPLPYLGYNADDGLILGLGVTFNRRKYGKDDFASRHRLNLKGSTNGNLQFSYDARYHHVIRKWDVVYHGIVAYPTDFVSFFGYGNESKKSDSLYAANYYKTRYNSIQLGGGVLKEFLKRSQFLLLINYENNDGQISENTILDQSFDILGTGKINLFELGAILDLDFRNDKKFPERGMRLFSEFNQGLITNNNNSTYRKFLSFIEIHGTVNTPLPLFIGIRGGGASSTGDLPFYKLVNLGQNNFLQGFRKNRFTGKSMVFFNTDLKIQLLDVATPVVPVKFGLRGFYDLGRVFIDEEDSDKVHSGYGGGIYFIPMEKTFSFSFSLAFSEEERSGLIVFDLGISF